MGRVVRDLNKSTKLALKGGFSMIEILVVIGVMAMLSSIVFTYGKSGESQIILFQEQAKIISIILRAKNLAIQTYLDEENICGYGVHVDSDNDRIILFKDKFDPCEDSDNKYTDSTEDFEITNLHERLASLEADFTDVIFLPPEPLTIFDGDRSNRGNYTLTIKADYISGSKEISINNFGQITAQ